MRKLLTIISIFILFTSCDNHDGGDSQFIHTGIFAQLGIGADTRTSIGDKNADTGKTPFLWSNGDVIGVYCEQNGINNKAIAIPSSADGQHVAIITTDMEFNGTSDHTFYFYYPYDGGQSASFTTNVSKTLASNQNGKIYANSFMWHSATTDSSQPSLDVDMSHTFAYLRFFVVNEEWANAGVTITNITFATPENTTAALAGNYTADLTNGNITFNSNINSIFMQPSTTASVYTAVPESKVGYPAMVINPSSVSADDTIRVTVSFSNGVTAYVDVTGKTFAKQKIYNITLKTLEQDNEFKIQVVAWDEVDCNIDFS